MGFRTFKLSRINHLQTNEQTYTPREDFADHEQKVSCQPELVTVKALISPGIKDQFIERHGQKSIEYYSPELYMVTFSVPCNRIGFKFLAGFGTELEMVEPQSYVQAFRNYLLEMVNKYKSSTDTPTRQK